MTTVIHTTNSVVEVDDYDESPEGVFHISVKSLDGEEVGYWVIDEIIEAPSFALGAIFGAIKSGKKP